MPLEASWGAFFTCLVGGGYLWLAIGREPRAAVLLLGAATVALTVAGVGGLDMGPLVVAGGVALSAVALALLDPAVRPRNRVEVRLPVLLLPAAALAIWLPYALAALTASRAGGPGDETNGISHWPVQASAGMALILGSALVALVSGVRPLQAAVGATGAIIALTTLAYPDLEGATGGPVWAVAALLWSVVVAVLPSGRRGARSTDPATRPPVSLP
jgi:hypothetical protein